MLNGDHMSKIAQPSGQPADIHPHFLPATPGELWPNTDCIYAGIMRGDAGELYHLLVSTEAMDLTELEWGAYGKEIKGADSTWDGLANTRALLASGLDVPATLATAGGKTVDDDGWYLPAQRELALCWATIPSHFRTDDWYWSSTQSSANGAWMQSFADGAQYVINKLNAGRVRLVRRLVIQ